MSDKPSTDEDGLKQFTIRETIEYEVYAPDADAARQVAIEGGAPWVSPMEAVSRTTWEVVEDSDSEE